LSSICIVVSAPCTATTLCLTNTGGKAGERRVSNEEKREEKRNTEEKGGEKYTRAEFHMCMFVDLCVHAYVRSTVLARR